MIALAVVALLILLLAVHLAQPVLLSGEIHPPPVAVDPARLEAHVRTLSERLVPRDAAHPQNLDRAAAYIRGELQRAGGAVEDQPYAVHGRTYRNVIARFGAETAERIVVGAHYDTDGPYPGADDNASGVAALIELAYLLGRAPPPLTVELVAYTLEEMPYFRTPHMGSAVHAASLKGQGIALRLMISLEMLGYYSTAPGSQRYPLPVLKLLYPDRGDFIAVVGKLDQPGVVRRVKRAMQTAASLPVYSINAPRSLVGVDFSDQLNYWEAGYPAVMITDTAFYRNPHYHTAQDTA
ncbi:MAG: M28 family peptidase, partial [Pseudomonadota bacterium]|nr:M28 family peptidase [Pseudomonadota bacterium]